MKSGIKLLVVVALLVGFTVPAFSQMPDMIDELAGWRRAGQAAMPFLRLGASARTMAMADAALALRGDPASLFYNPAGLAYVDGRSVMISNMNWLLDTSILTAAVGMSFGQIGTFGLSFMYYDYGAPIQATEIDATRPEGYRDIGTMSPLQFAIGLAYARQISDRFAIGGQVKMAYEDLLGKGGVMARTAFRLPDGSWKQHESEAKRSVVAFDFGTDYDTGFRGLVLAVAVRNFGEEVKYQRDSYDLPLALRFGVSGDFFRLLNIPVNGHRLNITGDYLHVRDWSEQGQIGLEYSLRDMFFVRGGYKVNYSSEDFCVGLGVKVPAKFGKVMVDYAFKNTADTIFDAVHVYSLRVDF